VNIRNLFSTNKTIDLPTTEESFNGLINTLVKKYRLPNWEHAAAVVANRIMHLPPDQATTTERYLAHCVLKNIAYQVAQARGQRVAHKGQCDELAARLKAEPNNQEARDTLQKAANEGSDYAKGILAKIDEPLLKAVPTPAQVLIETQEPATANEPAQG
jgi:hypothetical protein